MYIPGIFVMWFWGESCFLKHFLLQDQIVFNHGIDLLQHWITHKFMKTKFQCVFTCIYQIYTVSWNMHGIYAVYTFIRVPDDAWRCWAWQNLKLQVERQAAFKYMADSDPGHSKAQTTPVGQHNKLLLALGLDGTGQVTTSDSESPWQTIVTACCVGLPWCPPGIQVGHRWKGSLVLCRAATQHTFKDTAGEIIRIQYCCAMVAQEDSLLSLITTAADRSESTTIFVSEGAGLPQGSSA